MRLSIATKVFTGFGLLVAIFSGVLGFGAYRTQTVFTQIQSVNRHVVPLSLLLSDAQTDLKSFSLVLNESDPLVLQRTLQVARLDRSLPERIESRMQRASSMVSDDHPFDTSAKLDLDARVREMRMLAGRFAGKSNNLSEHVLQPEATSDFDVERIHNLQASLRRLARQLDQSIGRLRNDLRSVTDTALQRAADNKRTSLYALGALSVTALIVAVGVLLMILRTIRPLTRLTEATKRIGEGDYTPLDDLPSPTFGRDEISVLAREFNAMADKLAKRDAKLREQHQALLRAERLATVGRMTSLITHELRNPLSSISLNADMLQDELVDKGIDPADPEVMPQLNTIIEEVDRLQDITGEYLAHARLPAPDRQPVSLVDTVESLVDFHLGEWEREAVEVRVHAPHGDTSVLADSDHLRQALLNIVQNAIEASPEGGRVDIDIEPDEDVAEIRVHDEGPGIDSEVVDDIFEPFFTTKSDGTGLGLAMTQQIVEDHNGTIEIQSPSNDGCTFVIRLPRSE
jgi:signal transduction histidine kinase